MTNSYLNTIKGNDSKKFIGKNPLSFLAGMVEEFSSSFFHRTFYPYIPKCLARTLLHALKEFILESLIKLSSETLHSREMKKISLRLTRLVKRDDF